MPGNMGLKDQVLALEWIKEHISTFGGDASNVALVGAGAGGASAHLHFFSPLSAGLFHKAYSSSGNALMPNVVMKDIPEKTKRLASTLGCPTNSSLTMVQCLRMLPTLAIAGALQEFKVPSCSCFLTPTYCLSDIRWVENPFFLLPTLIRIFITWQS